MAVADSKIGACSGRLRHSATAKQYCPSSSTVARRQPRRRHVRAPKDLIQGLEGGEIERTCKALTAES
jgi:hypothetical protein